jgi:hypothetical protein
MLGLAPGHDLARGDVERREEIERAIADVVVRPPLGLTDVHRQSGLRALEGLNLRLLVDREHHRIGRRIRIQADDIADFVHELRIRREA